MNFINKTFKHEKQGWNISKFHELLHVPRLITLFGAPSNFDSGPCERMHKEVAKQPGRRSQKRHETFSYQAAKCLAEKHVLDLALNQLEKQPPTTSEEPAKSSSAGSQFVLICKLQANQNTLQPPVYNVSIKGLGLLANDKLLDKKLYPDLIQFIVVYLSSQDFKFDSPIHCCTEILDDSNTRYRAHHSYQSGWFWYDWAWVSYKTENDEEGFSDVPAKLLCVLPKGVKNLNKEQPDSAEPLVVCHPCMWQSQKVSSIVTKWSLVPCDAKQNNGIPYDIVPLSALTGHCLVVPDLMLPGVIYVVSEKKEWNTHFIN